MLWRFPSFGAHQPPATSPWYLAENFAFCERARQCGYQVMADTSIRLLHFGSYGYTWEDAGADPQRWGTYHFHLQPREKRGRESGYEDSRGGAWG
jgi:hypothetical protein